MGLSTFLALKYIKPKRSVASVITCVSILGVMLGVAVVIIVRSVMTGFGDCWREKILSFKPHVTIQAETTDGLAMPLTDDEAVADRLRAVSGITCVNPEVGTRVMLSNAPTQRRRRKMHPQAVRTEERVQAPILLGLGGDDFAKAYDIGEPYAGTFDLEPGGIVLGYELARYLGVRVGSAVSVCAPPRSDEVFLPREWKVTGIYRSGHHDFDFDFAIADLWSVCDLLGREDTEGVDSICLKTDTATALDPRRFASLVGRIDSALNGTEEEGGTPFFGAPHYRIQTWQEADKQIFDAIAVETNMTAVLLLLISLVALFCVMNTLLVLTVQKTPEIGLLKALGFKRRQIMNVFLVHGLIQCTIGILLGLLASWAVLSNLQRLVAWLGSMGMEVFPAEIYKLSEIPHRIVGSDVVYVVVIIYVFGLLASLVPALIAASKDPVKALNE